MKSNHLSKTFPCDVRARISEGIGFPCLEGLCVWKVVTGQSSWKTMKVVVCKAREAAALQVLLHQGPASPPLPMGPRCGPATSPARSLQGEGTFPWLKPTAATLWVLVPWACGVCSSGDPTLPCSLHCKLEGQAIREAAEST